MQERIQKWAIMVILHTLLHTLLFIPSYNFLCSVKLQVAQPRDAREGGAQPVKRVDQQRVQVQVKRRQLRRGKAHERAQDAPVVVVGVVQIAKQDDRQKEQRGHQRSAVHGAHAGMARRERVSGLLSGIVRIPFLRVRGQKVALS